MALRTVGARLVAEISDYRRNMREAGRLTRDFTAELSKAAKTGHLDAVADSAGMAGLAIGGMAGFAIKANADFTKAMSGVKAATHATAQDMTALREAALQAGKDTAYSATQAADAITELSKAGISTSDVLGGGLKGALSLAAAGELDVGDAAEIAASAMTQFKIQGSEVPHVADLLAAAAGKAQGNVQDMGYALKYAGLPAANLGVTLEETAGTLALFASNGLLGEQAGTGLRGVLASLTAPSEKAAGTMEDLGIQVYGANGKFIGMAGVAEQLRVKLGGVAQAQRDAALATIFGRESMPAAIALMQAGAEGVQDWTTKVNDAGYAAETAAIKTDNLTGDVERLRGSLETMAIESGGGANTGLRVLAQSANALVDQFSQLPSVVGGTITVLGAVSGAALLAGAGWIKMRHTSAEVRAELEAMGPAGAKAAGGMQKLGAAAGKATAAFVALEVASAVINHFQDDLNPQVEAMAAGLEKYAASGQLAGEASRVLGADLEDLKVGFSFLADEDNSRRQAVKHMQEGLESLIPGLDGTNTSLTRTKERIGAMDAALAQLAQGGNTEAARRIFDRLARELASGGVSMEEFRKQFPQYSAALEVASGKSAETASATRGLSAALDDGAQEQKGYKTAADAAAAATRGERDALVDLASKMKAETDPVFGLIDAQNDLTKAQKAAADAVKKHGRNSDEAREATRKLALAAINMQEKAGALSASFDGKLSPALRTTLRNAGLTEAQIKDVATQFKDAKVKGDAYAKKYKADVTLTGYDAVKGKLDRLSVYQQALKKGMPVGFHGPIVGPDGKGYDEGGWTGPGAKYDPAGVVHADEFVIRKESRRKIEAKAPGLLDEMNATGRLPGYDVGGMVWPYPATVAKSWVPSRAEAAAVVRPPVPAGGATGPWIERVAKQLVEGIRVLSGYRPGARTLTGNVSLHATNDARDFNASKELARKWDALYGSRTTEFISPYQQYNRLHGRRHTYTGAVWNQHNFAGGNPHDHIGIRRHRAMAGGGIIGEPVFGIGASGATYSFGENYQPERVVPNWQPAGPTGTAPGGSTVVNVTINAPVGSHPRDIGREVLNVVGAALEGGAELRVHGQLLLGAGAP